MPSADTHFLILFYPLAYPYQDDNSVAAATADGGNPYSSPLLFLLLHRLERKFICHLNTLSLGSNLGFRSTFGTRNELGLKFYTSLSCIKIFSFDFTST
jgi:hypothetical protein